MHEAMLSMSTRSHEDIKFFMDDYSFHHIIASSTRNIVLERVLPMLHESIELGHRLTAPRPKSKQMAMYWHEQIYLAIKERDGILARSVAEEHIKQTLQDARTNLTNKIERNKS